MLLLCGALLLALNAGIIWAGKVSEQRIKIYSSVETCQVEQSGEDCAKAFAGAEEQHTTTAPRSASRTACEVQYGSCAALHDGTGDWFVPAMVGFMLGHALGTIPSCRYGSAAALPLNRIRSAARPAPRACDR